MTEQQTNELIELAKINPAMANTAQELERLASLANDEAAKNLLIGIMRGYLSCAADDCHPFLEPMPLVQPHTVWRGEGDVGNVETYDANGSPVAVWRTTSFMHRLQFLYDGMLAVVYGSAPIQALQLRLDLKELNIHLEEIG
ncbi:hypothetical protein [Fibrivirga algicola]|uniref:Uncharacterized protein n=1 Tax=Fibrivirga algicola TaxID=2950420 RepID=A0ABX0QBV5_9BACT|nr:hypothetical protein [Fibrivirga algicola]NID09402.1 hypothetical protein [Fibrivirga algicola]